MSQRNCFPDVFRRILLAWMLAALWEYLLLAESLRVLTDTRGLAAVSLTRVIALTALFFFALFAIARFADTRHLERRGVALVFALLTFAALTASFTTALAITCVLIGTAMTIFAVRGCNRTAETISPGTTARKFWVILTAVLALLFFGFIVAWTVGRYASFSSPTYDFGIFSQMFYSMKEHGLPLTTLERNGLLSHFSVHVSPIYYLMLPFYCVFPHPVTLQILQAAVMASAVIPLWLIAKHRGFSGVQRLLVCTILLLLPAFSGGAGYDLHENCFLTTLIFWLFYAIERKKIVAAAVSALLTLCVKEDAAVYVAIIGLWLIVRSLARGIKQEKQGFGSGISLFVGAMIWFVIVTRYLAQSGDGVMTYRYQNLMCNSSDSLFAVVRAVIAHPMKVLAECVEVEKLRYIALTMLPLLGLPLLTRRFERWILLIPYLLVNLMTDYTYQYNIFFQYSFGSTAFLVYLSVVNLADWKSSKRRFSALLAVLLASAALLGAIVVPKAIVRPQYALTHRAYYQSLRDALAEIPQDAPAAASTFYTAALSQRDELYDLDYCTESELAKVDYVVISEQQQNKETLLAWLEENNFEIFRKAGNALMIYVRKLS